MANIETDTKDAAGKMGGETKRVIRIAPASKPELESKTAKQNAENFALAAKSFEPVVDRIVGVISGASVKFVSIAAENVLDGDTKNAERIASNCEVSTASREAIKTAGARIIARRAPDSEAMDWATLAAAVGEIGVGYTLVVRELIALKKMKLQAEINANRKANEPVRNQ